MMLPWLEAVAERLPRALRAPPVRMAILVTPNGVLPQAWEPVATEGGGYVPSFALTPISPRIRDVSVLTGLCNRQSFLGDGHYAKVAPLLTGQEIRRTGGRDLANGISMDQFAAQQLGGRTLLPSLELGCDPITPSRTWVTQRCAAATSPGVQTVSPSRRKSCRDCCLTECFDRPPWPRIPRAKACSIS